MASTMAAAEVRRIRSMPVIIDRNGCDQLPRGGMLTRSLIPVYIDPGSWRGRRRVPTLSSAPVQSSSRAVLITGCSSGIGAATARHLAANGWDVWATARDPERLADLRSAGCRTLALDLADQASMADAVAAVEAEHGAVGALVNNAGYSQSGAFEAVPMERVRAQFETNVYGLVELTRLVLPGMRRRRAGRIMNLSSMGGRLVFPGGAFYHATKHAVEALSDALRFRCAATASTLS